MICLGLLALAACSNGQQADQKQQPGTNASTSGEFKTDKRESYDAVGVAGGKESVSPFGKPANNAYTSSAIKEAIRQQQDSQKPD